MVNQVLKLIHYSCVQCPTGFLDLSHMNTYGYPVKHLSMCFIMFSSGIRLDGKIHAQGMDFPFQSCAK